MPHYLFFNHYIIGPDFPLGTPYTKGTCDSFEYLVDRRRSNFEANVEARKVDFHLFFLLGCRMAIPVGKWVYFSIVLFILFFFVS